MPQTIVKYYGSPGTGKTTKLQELVLAEIKQGTPLHRIGYLSFTKGAAEVIRERMQASEQDVRWFRTIHSACMALVGIGRESVITFTDYRHFREETGIEIRGDEFDDWDDVKPIDYTPTKRAMELSAATCTDIYDVIRSLPPHVNLTRERVELFTRLWTEYKERNKKFDFTDMLTKFLEHPSAMPVDVICLDEAQDLSELQWRVFKEMSKNAKIIYMVGDDDQAIFPFIGGSEYGFLEHPCDEEYVLTQSHRVPRAIGEVADHIIQKIAHRKSKTIKWKNVPGDVQRMNLDAFTLPWRDWLGRYKSIMVLCRHRRGARRFSDDLKAVGIPHDINGDGLSGWKEAKIVETYLKLRDGATVTVKAALTLLEELEMSTDTLQGLKSRSKVTSVHLPLVDFQARTWVNMFGGDSAKKLRRYEAIRKLINNDGIEALAKKPIIRVSTMHAVKGDQAELVIIVPECAPIVRQNMMTPGEIRLAYVAMTRAQKQAVILIPRTDSYITHFF